MRKEQIHVTALRDGTMMIGHWCKELGENKIRCSQKASIKILNLIRQTILEERSKDANTILETQKGGVEN